MNSQVLVMAIKKHLLYYAERTKQMEQYLRAKVRISFKSENLKKCF